jgi:hypothetical protein
VRRYCQRDLVSETLPRIICYVTASIICGIKYYDNDNDDDDDDDEWLMWICCLLIGSHYLCWIIPVSLDYFHVLNEAESYIPWHFEHIGIRFRAWIMLLLGEGVFSIIIEPLADHSQYYMAFFASILLLQVLQLAHFSIEEFNGQEEEEVPMHHAMFRSINIRSLWLELIALQSFSILMMCVGLQLQLAHVACEVDASVHHSCDEMDTSSRTIRLSVLCISFMAQYSIQQVIIIVHLGLSNYMNYMKGYLLVVSSVKACTMVAVFILMLFPSSLKSFLVLLIVASITTIQGVVQLFEQMIVHVSICDRRMAHSEEEQQHKTTAAAATATASSSSAAMFPSSPATSSTSLPPLEMDSGANDENSFFEDLE